MVCRSLKFATIPNTLKNWVLRKESTSLACVVLCRRKPASLIEAFKKLEAGDCKLVLAGDTDFEDEYSLGLKKMAQEAGVVLTGFVKGHKLHSLLTNARCYCLPSSHEGLPIALLEP